MKRTREKTEHKKCSHSLSIYQNSDIESVLFKIFRINIGTILPTYAILIIEKLTK